MYFDKIRFKHGLRTDLPDSADLGEPLYCKDTNELYIGSGNGRVPLGVVGPKGDKGEAGTNGRNGIDGRDGARGIEGPKGPKGDVGPQGIRGAEGPRGPKGDAGRDGADGLDGAQGPIGPIGPTGARGLQGLPGVAGSKGDAGKSIAIKGQKTTTADLPVVGVENEGWLIQGNLYVWDAVLRMWTNVGRIQGPRGETGEQGERGPAGPVNISDSLVSNDSNTAASSKAVSALKTAIDAFKNNFISKKGDKLTGALTFNGIYGLMWDTGRGRLSRIFWNATSQNDYGMQFEVDGQSNFRLKRNQVPDIFIDGEWRSLITKKDLLNLSSGGDFVGKKIKTGTFFSLWQDKNMALSQTITKTGTENIVSLTAISGFGGTIKIVVDNNILINEDVTTVFGTSTNNAGAGHPLILPFTNQIQIYTAGTGMNYGQNSSSFRWVQYYKE